MIINPVASSMKIAGIVTFAPSSPGAMLTRPGSLLIIIAATAPAFSAFKIFVPNWQVFLYITAILPERSLIKGLHPSADIGFP